MTTIEKLRDFILTYPELGAGSEIRVLPFGPNVTDGNGISYTGLGTPVIGRDVMGNTIITYRSTFSLDILRNLVDEYENEKITEFIIGFEKFVIEQSILGKAPRFGTDPDYQETMWAQGGILYQVQQDGVPIPFANYRTSIIIDYQDIFVQEEY